MRSVNGGVSVNASVKAAHLEAADLDEERLRRLTGRVRRLARRVINLLDSHQLSGERVESEVDAPGCRV